MTRSASFTEPVDASGVARAMRSARSNPAAIEFLISEDNGGAYHWRLVAGDGATLAQSGGFGSYDSAEQAARRVRDGAASARCDARAGEVAPVDLAAHRDRRSDELDAERWLDEGGSFSSEAVARWPAPR